MTTTPITPPLSPDAIEATFGDGQSGALETAPAPTLLAEWQRLGAFLRRPTLDVSAQNEGAFTVLARIYALDIAAMMVLIGLASALVAFGVYIPETALAGMEFTWQIIALVVIGAPVMEEVAFRGWLSGRPGPFIALLALAIGAAGFTVAHTSVPAAGAAIAIAGLLAGGLALFFLRKKPVMGWFAKAFPAFFWLSTISFALVHLANFEAGSLAVLLPLVLPQFILGMMLGYVRVRFALWAAIALHAAHNATAISIAALAGQLS